MDGIYFLYSGNMGISLLIKFSGVIMISSPPLRFQPLCDSLPQNNDGFFEIGIHCQVERGFAVFAFEGHVCTLEKYIIWMENKNTGSGVSHYP
jgi:hypothetical protein